jgi:hypothetical protein
MVEETVETPETPAVETPGAPVVDHKAELAKAQKLLKKFEGVDLEKYTKFKDFDFEKADAAIKAQEERERAEKEAQEEADREEAEKDPVTGLKKDLDNIKQTLAKKDAAEKEKIQTEWMEKFNSRIKSSIETALKEDFKDLEELSPQEKKYVVAIVNQTYETDSMQKVPKLNLETVSKVVSEVVKEVKENRAFLSSKKIRGQGHPVTPSSQDGSLPSRKPKTEGERLEAMVNFYKGDREGQA